MEYSIVKRNNDSSYVVYADNKPLMRFNSRHSAKKTVKRLESGKYSVVLTEDGSDIYLVVHKSSSEKKGEEER